MFYAIPRQYFNYSDSPKVKVTEYALGSTQKAKKDISAIKTQV